MLLISPVPDHDPLLGRAPLLDYLRAQLQPSARTRVVVLHGEAGVGKSALATALAATWASEGGVVLEASPGAAPVKTEARRLLVVDPAGDPLPQGAAAWRPLLEAMEPADRLLVAARAPVRLPIDDARHVEVRVTPLGWDDSSAILIREGVASHDRPALVRWGRGLPLLLVLGAQAKARHPDWDPEHGAEPAALTERLRLRLGFEERPGPRADGVGDAGALDAAKQAVRDYTSVERLAANPLSEGATPAARATHVRALVDAAVAAAFGTSRTDVALREVLVAGYLVAAKPHEQLADDLFLSRTTYFRHLRAALRRVGDQLDGALRAERACQLAA